MSDKRIFQLTEATDLTGVSFLIDKSGNSEAEQTTYENLLADFGTNVEITEAQISDLQSYLTSISGLNISDLVNDSGFITLADIPAIPDQLSDLSDDSTHRLVTDTEKSTWNAKQAAGDYATNSALSTGLSGKSDTGHNHSGVYVEPSTLGDSAGLDVGTTAGTVAAGNDSRLSDARTPTSHDNTYHSTSYLAATNLITDFISGLIASPANGDYVILRNAPYAGTITALTTKSSSGTCTLTGYVNTTALGGSANTVDTDEEAQAHSSANTFSAGDDIKITVSSNSSCANMEFTMKFTRPLS
jgi:hypothetical protein